MVRVSQPVLSMLPSGARAIGPSAGLLEGPDGGVVFVFGLATFSYAAGDEVGRRLTAVQLVAMRISSAREVAGAFGVSTVTLWRWSQTFAHGGVLALGRDRSGPKGPTKLTEVVTARIVALDGQGRTLAQIAAGTAVSTATVRVALGRVAPRAPSVQVSGQPNVADDWQIDGDGEQDTEASVGAELVVLAAPVPRVAERTAARFGDLAEAPVVLTEGAHLPLVGLLLGLPALEMTGLLDVATATFGSMSKGFYGLRATLLTGVFLALLREPRAEGATRIAAAGAGAQRQAALGAHHAATRPDAVGFLYLDGHVRVYTGTRQLPKTHIAR